MAKTSPQKNSQKLAVPLFGAVFLVVIVAAGIGIARGAQPKSQDAPEAQKILDVQAHMPFQVLIPAYMPRDFIRGDVEIALDDVGPGGEPMIQLSYRTRNGETLFLKEWVPINPEKEILASSRPVETKWGQGWLLRQSESLAALWVDIGPLRASIYSPDAGVISPEELLEMAETLGPASNRQVFSFSLEMPTVREVEPPPPFEVPINEDGIQEITLVVTPGGYSPVRFSVRQGIPVRLIFRQLGQVGCGNVLIFPTDPENTTALTLESASDKKILEFTPSVVGDFHFTCSHQMYRGMMKVVP